MSDINNLGTFTSITAVWKKHPEGGKEGDYLFVNETKYRWNKYDRIWENAATVTESPARETKTFDGDVVVGNDLTVGGTIKAKGFKQPNCGLFASLDALKEAYPTPEVGMWAVVGNTMPGDIYRCNTAGVWTATGEKGGVDKLDLTEVNKAISSETTARIAADKSLQDAITREASDRKTADDTLQAHIDNISGHAYNGAFLKVEDFSDGVNPAISESDRRAVIASNCKEWLDGVKFNGDDWRRTGGRCKLAFDGANFECYNFELFVSGNIGLQVVVGAVNYDPAYDTIVTNNGTFNVLYRRHTADGWGEWTDIRTSGILQETGDATDKTMSQKAVTEALRTITDRLDKAGDAVGGNTVNVTEEYPLGSGYHTLSSAIRAVEAKRRAKGRCITFEASQGKYVTKQFAGTDLAAWESEGSWEDFGAGGTVRSVTLNGGKMLPDGDGDIALTVDRVEVDESLDAESTNPVQNKAIAARLGEVEASTVFGMTAELSGDESTVHLALTNKSGAEIVSADIPAGKGGGGETQATRIVLSASVDKTTVKEGDSVKLTYTYDHLNTGGESTGQKAAVRVTVRRGATTTYDETTQDMGRGTYTLDLTKHLLAGTSDIYVTATATDPETGKAQRKQAYVGVRSVTLSLSSGYNLAAALQNGGYASGETVSVPYTVGGTGTKTVTMYLDGRQKEAHTVTRSGTTNGSFGIAASGLSAGRHTVQMVAEMEAGGGLTLKSDSIHIDILKAGDGAPFVGLMLTHRDGRISGPSDHLTPTLGAGRYEACVFKFAAYDPAATPASVEICRNGKPQQTVSVPRTVQDYRNRFTEKGRQTLLFKVGKAEHTLYVDVADGGIDIGEAAYGLVVKLSPAGRSNGEADPARWESGGVKTMFEGFDWSSNGWTGDSLKLSNGARAVIGYKPFKEDAGATGMTLEMEFRVTGVTDRSAEVISCMSGGKGLSVTATEAGIRTGTVIHYTNEDGKDASREIKIGTKFAPDEWLKVAFVIGRRTEGRLMELYVNGNRAGADIYDSGYYFRQDTPAGITLSSEAADLEVRNIRIYNRPLTDDEVLENRMVDADSAEGMVRLYEENDILGETGGVDIDRLRAKGKGVMRIVRKGGLDEVNETNNKKTDFSADVYFYSPFGKEHDFILHDCYIRIQGTSSTKYPSKNIRIYFGKGGANLSLEVNGKKAEGKTYSMRPGGTAMNLYCMKSDYSDSSMSLNTGGAKLFNDVMKELGLLTPPQRYQYEQGGKSLNAVTVRQSIDGFPIDIFSAETADGESAYFGQYNFNNEKSKSGKLFGMEGVDGFTPECPLTLETLNNGEKTCLFQSASDEDLAAHFDAGLETNYPDDVKWAGLDEKQRSALKRLFGWIRQCVPAGAAAGDLSTFRSVKFVSELGQYFDKGHLLTYYIHTDYFASVDQRAKNILLRTWDGKKWYLTYYDGDTQLGKRNDCFLAYDYTIGRDTYDAEASKYAFEGRESWLWNLVLANLGDDLKKCAADYRAKMTPERVLEMLAGEQMGAWSDRAYNKSGYLKYIRPAMVETYGKKWPFIYALQGSNKAFLQYFVRNRFALLDAKYGTNSFTSDNIDLYMSRSASDPADTLKITAGEVYAFGYGTNNSPNLGGTGMVDAGKTAELRITGSYTVNDPLRVYGASRMQVLDMTGAADRLKNGLDLGKCAVLRELDLQSGTAGSTGWWLNTGSCRQLRKVNLRNQRQAKTGGSTSTELDFSNQTKLEDLDARGTQVRSVSFAKGAPLTSAKLPGTLAVLKLEYLRKLTTDGLTLEDWSNVSTLVVDGCPNISWETLLSRCTGVERLRVTGIDREDDGTWLSKFMAKGGVDAGGSATDTCALVGTVRLTSYMADETYAKYAAHFPELNIRQPEYTVIEFDDTVADDANVSNLDNRTGYKFGTAYRPSGHILRILAQRHRVLAKVTAKGEALVHPLHDRDSNFYADAAEPAVCTPAVLTGEEGDWMVYEPHYWYKGVNDTLNGKKYAVYASGRDMPPVPDSGTYRKIAYDRLEREKRRKVGIDESRKTMAEAVAIDGNYDVVAIDCRGWKRVRFVSVNTNDGAGNAFTDGAGNILSRPVTGGLRDMFTTGMYLITDVPAGAEKLYVSVPAKPAMLFDFVLLSNSANLLDMEPEWVEHAPCLAGVVKASLDNGKYRSVVRDYQTGLSYNTSVRLVDKSHGMGVADYEHRKDTANLFAAKYGRRNSQAQTGMSQFRNYENGLTAALGMEDTAAMDNGLPGIPGLTGGLNGIEYSNVLGYEAADLRYEILEGLSLNRKELDYVPLTKVDTAGSERYIPEKNVRQWMSAVVHGRYMDILAAGSFQASSSTYYSDYYQNYKSSDPERAVIAGNASKGEHNGVFSLRTDTQLSTTNSDFTVRMMFRGKVSRAGSVEEFKRAKDIRL